MTQWQLKRQDNQAVLQLHSQYHWQDQHDWTPLAQSDPVYTLTGAMIVQQGTKKAGRPITLDCGNARIVRADVITLQAWAAVPELEMLLTQPNGNTFNVIFSRPALSNIKEIKPLRNADQQANDKMQANIHLITV